MAVKHLALLVVINLSWGFNFIAGKWGTEQFGALTFSAVRFAIVLLLLFPFLRFVPGQLGRILLIGFLLGACHYSIMFLAMSLTENISAVAVAAQLLVPFSTILAIVFLGERIGMTRTAAIALSFIGVVVLAFEPFGAEHTLSLVLTVLGAFSMAVAAILMRSLKSVGVFNLQAWIAVVATIVLSALALFFEPQQVRELSHHNWLSYWLPLYSAVGATIFGHGAFYWLLQRYPVNQVSPFISLSTLFAVGFGITLLNDLMTVKIIIGSLLTIAGVTIIAIRNAKDDVPSGQRAPR